jgi:hypothetical protein
MPADATEPCHQERRLSFTRSNLPRRSGADDGGQDWMTDSTPRAVVMGSA